MMLEDIGFYTLTDERVENSSSTSQMMRTELIITDACNFSCTYCRGVKRELQGSMSWEDIFKYLHIWAKDNLKNIRFSGGEPTMNKHLPEAISLAKEVGIERIAVSTNGTRSFSYYEDLITRGVNDFSISLDACCSETGTGMAGGITEKLWERTTENIRQLAELCYVTVGVVVNEDNLEEAVDTIRFAHSLGVADIRIIPSAQYNLEISGIDLVEQEILDVHPILSYRIANMKVGKHVRGISLVDSHKCGLVHDDSIILKGKHFPCVIYMREGGEAIGEASENMREERIEWYKNHNTFTDDICRNNCLDICIQYNNAFEKANRE